MFNISIDLPTACLFALMIGKSKLNGVSDIIAYIHLRVNYFHSLSLMNAPIIYYLSMRLAFVMLALCLMLVSCNQRAAIVQIVEIVNDSNGSQIEHANMTLSPADLGPGEDGSYYKNIKSPINLPVEVGKCTYILIEADGYHDWEEAFCPQKAERIDVEISLVPKLPAPVKLQET